MTVKRAAGIFILWLVALWFLQIINVNISGNMPETVYDMQETFEWNGVEVTATETYLYTQEEYNKAMGTSVEMDTDGYLLCLKVKMTNPGKEDISWDMAAGGFGYGFESDVWCSVSVPYLCSEINLFSSEVFKQGTSQDICFVTIIDKVCFKKNNVNKIPFMQYYYVLSMYPNPIRIKLNLDNIQ